MSTFLLVVDLGGLALGLWLLFRTLGSKEPSVLRVLGVLSLMSAVLCIWAMIAAALIYDDNFATLRAVCHVLFCVLAPLYVLRGLQQFHARAWKFTAFGTLLVVLGLGMDLCYLYATRIEPYRLQLRRYDVSFEKLNGIPEPIKILILADLQTDKIGSFEAEVFRKMDEEKADLILFPGDFLQCQESDYAEQQAKLVALFQKLEHRPKYGMFAVDGDADLSSRSLEGTKVRTLVNETVPLASQSQLQIIGIDLLSSTSPDGGMGGMDEEVLREVHGFSGLSIVMGHRPDFVEDLMPPGISFPVLCVAGHTHGGQVSLPFYGPPITVSRLPREIAAGGLHAIGLARLVISRGIGMVRGYAPRIRFLVPPELVVLTLRGTDSD